MEKNRRLRLGVLLMAVFFIAGCTGNGLNISTRAELLGFFPDGTLQILRKVFTWAGGDTVPVYVCDESVILKVRPMTSEERVKADEVLKDFPKADPPDPYLYYMILDVRFPSEHYYAQNKQCFNEESLKKILVGTTLTELIRAGGFIGGMKLRNPDIFKQSIGQSVGNVAGGAANAFSEGSSAEADGGSALAEGGSANADAKAAGGSATSTSIAGAAAQSSSTSQSSSTAISDSTSTGTGGSVTVPPAKPPVVHPPHPVHPPKPPVVQPTHPEHPDVPKGPPTHVPGKGDPGSGGHVKPTHPEHPVHPDVPKGPPTHVPGKGDPGSGGHVKPTHPEHPEHPDVPKGLPTGQAGLPAGQAGPPSQVPGKGTGLNRGNAGNQQLRVW